MCGSTNSQKFKGTKTSDNTAYWGGNKSHMTDMNTGQGDYTGSLFLKYLMVVEEGKDIKIDLP